MTRSFHPAGRNRHAAFTLVELLVVIGIIVVLAGILLPVANRAQEQARRVKCSANLRSFGQAMLAYSSANKGQFPRTFFNTTNNTRTYVIADTTGDTEPMPFAPTGTASPVGDNNVPASIFLLLRQRLLTPEALLCPSALAADTAESENYGGLESPAQRSNFSLLAEQKTMLSYSMAVPFPMTEATREGYAWDNSISPDFAIAADRNPGDARGGLANITWDANTDDMSLMNSMNHRGLGGRQEGQNVLYGDMHVEWSETPYAGMQRTFGTNRFRDNIFTANPPNATSEANQLVEARPGSVRDSILLPAADSSP